MRQDKKQVEKPHVQSTKQNGIIMGRCTQITPLQPSTKSNPTNHAESKGN